MGKSTDIYNKLNLGNDTHRSRAPLEYQQKHFYYSYIAWHTMKLKGGQDEPNPTGLVYI